MTHNLKADKSMLLLREAWYSKLMLFAFSYVREKDVAEDLVQDTFLKVIENKIDVNECENIGAFLYTILKNKCLDYLKHKLVEYKHNKEMVLEYNMLLINQYALEDSSIQIITNNQIKQALKEALDKLPEQTRKVFIMSKYQHKKYDEISKKLGLSSKTVEYHIAKAYNFLRKEMKEYYILIYLISAL